jgi:hypothetical protein
VNQSSSPDISPTAARVQLALVAILAVSGAALAINRGRLPQRESDAESATAAEEPAPDLQLYREVVADVRAGIPYYASARHQIPWHGFPIASPLNWRLPTYAWLFALLPGPRWVQAALVVLSLAALALAWSAQSRSHGSVAAAITCLLLVGTVRWALDGDAYLAQEPWAATLLIVSLSAHSLGDRWRSLAIAAGLFALFIRELALPYCGVACLLALWHRRWRDGALWTLGISAFFAFYAWHVGQVRIHLAGSEPAAAGGLSQWLRFGGLDFVLLTTRMNGILFSAPAPLLWLYSIACLFGLASSASETSRLACLAAAAYLLAFAVIGRSENFYWGLLPAPLLAFGLHGAPAALVKQWNAAFPAEDAPGGRCLPAN